jgi:hypothetical protein
MAKLKGFFEAFNTFTGISARHNHALAEIKELSDSLREFLGKYSTPDDVFSQNIGMAQTEITTLIYHIRTRIKIFRSIKGKKVLPLVQDLYNNLESVRVDIFNPKKGRFSLAESLSRLNGSFQALTEAISEIEFK